MRGRCLCGSVKYTFASSIISCAHCHCESCRRASSAAFVTWAKIFSPTLIISAGCDKLACYESSAGAYRKFCGLCGSQLFMEYADEPEYIYLTLSSFEAALDLIPEKHVSYEEKINWLSVTDSLPKFYRKSHQKIG